MRLLTDAELRELFATNELSAVRDHYENEERDLRAYLDLAGCKGDRRTRAEGRAAADPRVSAARVGWYLLARP